MDKKILLDIINNGIDEIKVLCSNFQTKNPSQKDIEITIQKTEILLKELSLLQDCESKPIIEEIKVIPEPIIENKIIAKEIKIINEHKDIRSFIGINDKFLFIRELFNGDSVQYNECLEEINRTNSIKEAFEINSRYKWDKEEDSTKLFTEILNRKFV
jgi:hypothetical protein